MEDYLKEASDTTSSNFFASKLPPASKSYSPQGSTHFFDQGQSSNRIPQLESKLLALITIVEQLKDDQQRVSSDETLDEWQQERLSALEEIRTQNKGIEKQIKLEISAKFDKLDKDLQHLSRNQAALKEKYERILHDGVEEMKRLKECVLTNLSKEKKERSEELKRKFTELKREHKSFTKNESKFKRQVFGQLELVRGKFQDRLKQEETKRNHLENLIQSLLEKTCEKAGKSIRRKIFVHSAS